MTTLHMALQVRDLEASIDFYERLFGMAPAKRFDDYAKFEVAEPPLILSLNPGSPDAPRRGWRTPACATRASTSCLRFADGSRRRA